MCVCVGVCVVVCVYWCLNGLKYLMYLSLSVFKPEYKSQPGRRDSELRTRMNDNKVGYKKI